MITRSINCRVFLASLPSPLATRPEWTEIKALPLPRSLSLSLTTLLVLFMALMLTGVACSDNPNPAMGQDASVCPVGTMGCPCYPNRTCDSSSAHDAAAHGTTLVCGQDDTCTPLSDECTPGTPGCSCLEDLTCNPPNDEYGHLECLNDVCVDVPCDPGTFNCACYPNNTCNVHEGTQLACEDGLCVSPSCTPGEASCACTQEGTCSEGLICEENLSDQPRCVIPDCDAGTESCHCRPDFGCDNGLICNDGLCKPLICTPGSVGCECASEFTCHGTDTYCDEQEICQIIDCPAGHEGCACVDGANCGYNSRGEVLTCTGGICVSPSCVPGTTGCVCEMGHQCSRQSDQCSNGFCQPRSCTPGALNCPCVGGGCGPGLMCSGGSGGVICLDNAGHQGGWCFENGTCLRGNRCQDEVCIPCLLGSLGCACDDGDGCRAGLECLAGFCLQERPSNERPPENPRCYTPCERDLVDVETGDVRKCSVDGLLEGCVDGFQCVDGTCTRPGNQPGSCVNDLSCPTHQTCIESRCYSQCEQDSQCPTGMSCHLKVCRIPCRIGNSSGASGSGGGVGGGGSSSSGGGTCPNRGTCHTVDGENGWCMDVAAPSGEPLKSVDGSFSLDKTRLELNPLTANSKILLSNDSDRGVLFTVRKRSQLVTYADGSVEQFDNPADGPACNPMVDCPLVWLNMGVVGQGERVQEFEVFVEGGQSVTIEFSAITGKDAPSWQGRVEVSAEGLGNRTILLDYNDSNDGRWSGTVYYFANFGTTNLDTWKATQASRDNSTTASQVGNALVQRWAGFRKGNISFEELQAVLESTRSGSWSWPNVKKDCPATGSGGACYLYSIDDTGLVRYTSDLVTRPIPSGMMELPFAAYLRAVGQAGVDGSAGAGSGGSQLMAGRIDSTTTLQYPGNPALNIGFVSTPQNCDRTIGGTCFTFMDSLRADVVVGGRYQTDATDGACVRRSDPTSAGSYQLFKTPWLLPGFVRMTSLDEDTGGRYRYECRDTRLPFSTSTGEVTAPLAAANHSLAMANPLPDGRSRKRQLTLIDGAIINHSWMFILFEESMASFFPGDTEPIKAYGYMLLKKEKATIDPADEDGNGLADTFEGAEQADSRAEPQDVLELECSPEMLAELKMAAITADNASAAVDALINGVLPGVTEDAYITPEHEEAVHYLCGDNGLFDAGRDGLTKCPAGSTVTFFTVHKSVISTSSLLLHECQKDGSCRQVLNGWIGAMPDSGLVQIDPVWQCTDPNAVYCDANRLDLRDGKRFFAQHDTFALFPPLYAEIDSAFRYKTRFRSRTGKQVGFAPQICIENSDQIPYCYDPGQVEHIRQRVDCLLHIWQNWYVGEGGNPILSVQARRLLDDYLCTNYSYTEACIVGGGAGGAGGVHDGFEHLYAELLVMMGDEAYTAAFASRFDLAGSASRSFEGSLFESGGINLSGAAGNEMYNLYKAVQYYQEALDRFHGASPYVWSALGHGQEGRNFVTPETATTYLDRLTRASSQKARAWSEIAIRYQNFNRADLARKVVERAYTSNYLEAVVLSRVMHRVTSVASQEDRAQVIQVLEEEQKRNSMALLDMRNVYQSITDEINYFGFAPDYIPFPTLSNNEDNAFSLLLSRARQKLDVARYREDAALNRSIGFETDSEQFQAELVQLRNNYEGRLAELCGTFQGADGRIYPAVERYAELDERARMLINPCGLLGTGSIYSLLGQLEGARVDMQRILVSNDNLLEEVAIEKERVNLQCDLIDEVAEYVYEKEGEQITLEEEIQRRKFAISRVERAISTAATVSNVTKCSIGLSTDCPSAAVAMTVFLAASVVGETAISFLEDEINDREVDIKKISRSTAKWQTTKQCDAARIDSDARTATLLLRLKEIELEALRADYQMRQILAEVRSQYNLAKRLGLEMGEAEGLAINVQAAKSDPNVRIYRNDAIVNADLAFNDALRTIYQATRVYEYYTSQSYDELGKLFLIRMVQFGDYNLENYLTNLENAFYDFQESYGRPDRRVSIISLRDDILHIPRLDEEGRAISQTDRILRMRQKLADVNLLDERGYLTIQFSTDFQRLSPLTRNHKIEYMEAELIGSELGDTVGRLYLQQQGTSVVSGLVGEKIYYRFPERTAVVNPFFNGNRVFNAEVYRNERMRDRPYVNTSWDLVVNQRDEWVNQDINLQSLTDIRLFVYYTDFTSY